MSSPYGPVDPNRIALNKQAREAQARYQAQQQAIAAEQQRQRQLAAQRQAEQDAARAKSTVTSRRVIANDELFSKEPPVDTTQSDFEIFKAFEAANPDANLNSLNITRDSSGKIKSINGNLYDQKLYSDLANTGRLTDEKQGLIPIYGKVQEPIERAVTPGGSFGPPTQTISFTAGLAPLQDQLIKEAKNAPRGPSTSPEAVNILQQQARSQGYNLQGYYVSKDSSGRITEYGGTFGDPLIGSAPYYRQQYANSRPVNRDLENLNYSIFKENQIIKAQNAGAPSAYRLTNGDISNLRGAGYDNVLTFARQEGQPDFGFASPVAGKPFSFEQVGPYGQVIKSMVAPRGSQNNVAYNVNIPESISITDKATALPSSPVEGFKQSAQNFIDQNLLGFFGTGIGIGSIFTGLAGQPLSPYTKQLIETKGEQVNNAERPELLGGAINAGIQQAGGKSDAFSGFVNTLETAPLFFAGSAGFTALTFASPGGAVRGVRAAAEGLGFLARETPRAASELSTILQARAITSINELPYGSTLLAKSDSAVAKLASGIGVVSKTISSAKMPLNAGITELKYGVQGVGKAVSSKIDQVQQTAGIYGSIGKDTVQAGFSRLESAVPRSITESRTVGEFSLLPTRVVAGLRYDIPEAISSFPLTRAAQNFPDALSEFYSGTSRGVAQGLRSIDTRARLAVFDAVYPLAQGIAARKTEAEFLAYLARERVNQALPSLDPYAVFSLANRAGKPIQPIGEAFSAFSTYTARGVARTGQDVKSLFADTVQDFGDLKEQFAYDFETKVAQPVKNQLRAEYNEAIGLSKFLGGPIKGQLAAEYNEAIGLSKFLGGPLAKPIRADIASYRINKFNLQSRKAAKKGSQNALSRGFFGEGTPRKSNVQPKTSFSPLDNIGLQVIDNGLRGSKESTQRAVDTGLSKFLGVGGNANSAFSGSAVKSRAGQSETSFLRYPGEALTNRPTRTAERESTTDLLKFNAGEGLEPAVGSNLFNVLGKTEVSRSRNRSESLPVFSPVSLFDLEPKKGAIQSPESIVSPLLTPTEDTSTTPFQTTGEDFVQVTTQTTEQPSSPDDSGLFFFGGYDESHGKRRRNKRLRYTELVFRSNDSIFAGTSFAKAFKIFPIE